MKGRYKIEASCDCARLGGKFVICKSLGNNLQLLIIQGLNCKI